jgi:hypothetical protein
MDEKGSKTAHWGIPKKSERVNNDTLGSWVLWINTINPNYRLKKGNTSKKLQLICYQLYRKKKSTK